MFKTRRYRPLMEPLEDRSLPSCTVFVQGDTLFIRGDDAGDIVKVAVLHKQTTVICNGGSEVANTEGIKAIVADLGGGKDSLDFRRDPPPDPWEPFSLLFVAGSGDDVANLDWAPGGQDSIWIDMGLGNDTLDVEVDFPPTPNLPGPTEMTMSLFGGSGRDRLNSRMNIQPTPFHKMINCHLIMDGGAGDDILAVNTEIGPGPLVGANPPLELPVFSFDLDLRGSDGNDRIVSRMGIEPTPFHKMAACDLTIDGGTGDDVLDAQFSTGTRNQKVADLRVALLGGDGNDALRLSFTPGGFAASAFADGGMGFDTGRFSPGVKHVNVEQVG